MTGGTVLDVSAITDLATQRTVYAAVVLGQAVDRGQDVVLPAAAWLDAWAEASPAAMPFLELLRSNRAGTFAELDEAAARGTELGPTLDCAIWGLQNNAPTTATTPAPCGHSSPPAL